ncbi:GntR family transcriptional regulator [Bordetella petrii]|uniref:GntR family transcriptional regulator n=1 Tax=Bordetella petrii TaxID=94624 RepID=UPI001A961C2A|nr:GntR family transcriptional regulator [Bordetella petrii]MBO1110621.1 GntR family transcriptional regulator [Bordetella petrii]
MNQTLKPVQQSETLGAQVLQQIKEILLTGRITPGESLSLRSAAESLGVSMMPVRQAVHQLVADQALEVTPNRSVRVPVMTAAQFHEVTQIRLEVESYAVEKAVPNVDPALVQSLRELNAALSKALTAGGDSLGDAVLLNKTLHFSIYSAANMPTLVKMIESLWLRIGPILNYDLRSGSERTLNKVAVAHHDALINALEAQDIASARKALQQDIETAYQYIVSQRYAGLATRHGLGTAP